MIEYFVFGVLLVGVPTVLVIAAIAVSPMYWKRGAVEVGMMDRRESDRQK